MVLLFGLYSLLCQVYWSTFKVSLLMKRANYNIIMVVEQLLLFLVQDFTVSIDTVVLFSFL